MQGIPWYQSANQTRAQYRKQRNEQYTHICRLKDSTLYDMPIFENIKNQKYSGLADLNEFPVYAASHMSRSFACGVHHFQLRHLLCAPTASSVIYTCMLTF